MATIDSLAPNSVWRYFDAICKIPRPSKHEEKIRAFLLDFAASHNLLAKRDAVGNVLITKSETPGFETKRTIVLQSHLDMVCEKNSDTIHDFFSDPIRPIIDGEWVTAQGTTLGADCGIGIATQLAVLAADNLQHGPIECLFTVDEETGLTGAKALQSGFFTGQALINLDSEDEGELFIGCAGGIDTVATISYQTQQVPQGYFPLRIAVSGLLGGHSGDDIDKNRGNAIKILNRFLGHLVQNYTFYLQHLEGGNLRNAIAREAFAIVLVPNSKKESVAIDFNLFRSQLETEMVLNEPLMQLTLESTEASGLVLDQATQTNLIRVLYACPHGVLTMSTRMPGLVETSTNLASVKFKPGNKIEITTSQRSDLGSAIQDASAMVHSVFQLIGAETLSGEGYPGWTPNPTSELLELTKAAYFTLFHQTPVVRSIHAGLECGLFLEKFPGLDMISFGPTMRGVHSPDEKINIETVDKFWKLLVKVLENY